MRLRSRSCAWWLLLALAAAACGSSGKSSGGAAGSGSPRAGEPCQNGSCPLGLSCEHNGVFHGLCTAGCSTDQGCGLLNPKSHCFGMVNSECAIPCSLDTECAPGTHCVSVGGIGTERACQVF